MDTNKEETSNNSEKLNDEEWLDSGDVCSKLKISKRTLEEYRKKKILKYAKFIRKCYYKKEDVMDLLKKNFDK